jgi:flagellar motor switch protein FliM
MTENELAKMAPVIVAEPQSMSALAAIVPAWMMRIEEHPSWPLLSRMTVTTMAGVPLSGFKIGDLLRLKPGQIVESKWPDTEDIPLKAGDIQVAWSEFEVLDQHLLVRLTRLA